ncbi:hypothetical protein L1987_09309 [Smallanthus sonchifolius]|uniref:Uncharacterized protein n=1 Tax=Smallanthus sonchifolius TaxID=185202 RepID=A0ACB9JN18_9ASTR|nr:hypothetical protein L1987_09309 [Smallanthus sonchifolius]
MASQPYSRSTFINSTIKVARDYGFDGVDLDWEFPSNESDMSNLGLLFNEWREALEHEADITKRARLVLTSAVYYDTNFGIGSWIQGGVPPEKIVMGLPLYGPTWSLENPNINTVGAPTTGTGPGSGLLVYSQVIDFNRNNNATIVFDNTRISYYSYAGDSWVSYDDIGRSNSKSIMP